MNALLDTHAFLWWVTDDKKLSATARRTIPDPRNRIFLSAASAWEIVIKASIGRLVLPAQLEPFLTSQISANGFELLPIQLAHALCVHALPSHHKDPFDRMLIAQAQVEKLTLLTADRALARYNVKTIW